MIEAARRLEKVHHITTGRKPRIMVEIADKVMGHSWRTLPPHLAFY